MARGKKERKRRRKWSKKKGRRRAAIRMTLAGSFTLTVRRSRTVGQTDRQQDTVRGQSGEGKGREKAQYQYQGKQLMHFDCLSTLPHSTFFFAVFAQMTWHTRADCGAAAQPTWLPQKVGQKRPRCCCLYCCCSCCCSCSCRCCKPAKTTLATWAWVGGAASANESVSAFLACCLSVFCLSVFCLCLEPNVKSLSLLLLLLFLFLQQKCSL